jgi:hypothetical protein
MSDFSSNWSDFLIFNFSSVFSKIWRSKNRIMLFIFVFLVAVVLVASSASSAFDFFWGWL